MKASTAKEGSDLRVVWVTPYLEAHPRSGGTLRTHRLLQTLRDRFAVDLVVLTDRDLDLEVLKLETGVRSVTVHNVPRGRLLTRANQLLRLWPNYVSRVWVPAAASPDGVVVLDHLSTWPYRTRRGPYILHLHNVESEVIESLPPPSSSFRRLERRWERWTMGRLERRAVNDSRSRVVVVSQRDAEVLGVPATVVPNGADRPESPPRWEPRGSILFVASLDYPPNAYAVDWWIDAVSPLLPERIPALTVVGRGSTGSRRSERVSPVGEVPSVAPYLASASVVVIPLHHGGGTRLKLLEALAWGRPVVTTSKGAEGLPVRHESEVLLADDPAGFARAVARAWEDEDLAVRLGDHGRRFAEEYYWDRIGGPFVELVSEVAAAFRSNG